MCPKYPQTYRNTVGPKQICLNNGNGDGDGDDDDDSNDAGNNGRHS